VVFARLLQRELGAHFQHTEGERVSAMDTKLFHGPFAGQGRRMDEPVAEVSLLMPTRLAAEIERLARSRGMTLGQLIRLLIREHLDSQGGAGGRGPPSPCTQ
jgi:hypothetical protein